MAGLPWGPMAIRYSHMAVLPLRGGCLGCMHNSVFCVPLLWIGAPALFIFLETLARGYRKEVADGASQNRTLYIVDYSPGVRCRQPSCFKNIGAIIHERRLAADWDGNVLATGCRSFTHNPTHAQQQGMAWIQRLTRRPGSSGLKNLRTFT